VSFFFARYTILLGDCQPAVKQGGLGEHYGRVFYLEDGPQPLLKELRIER
jgi:hypothetical protein